MKIERIVEKLDSRKASITKPPTSGVFRDNREYCGLPLVTCDNTANQPRHLLASDEFALLCADILHDLL